ncbi:hypothetical protein L1887_53985 [Cichorium endivia]|nr:hypothetical protein L1887_53985 [Cichorium endivia]
MLSTLAHRVRLSLSTRHHTILRSDITGQRRRSSQHFNLTAHLNWVQGSLIASAPRVARALRLGAPRAATRSAVALYSKDQHFARRRVAARMRDPLFLPSLGQRPHHRFALTIPSSHPSEHQPWCRRSDVGKRQADAGARGVDAVDRLAPHRTGALCQAPLCALLCGGADGVRRKHVSVHDARCIEASVGAGSGAAHGQRPGVRSSRAGTREYQARHAHPGRHALLAPRDLAGQEARRGDLQGAKRGICNSRPRSGQTRQQVEDPSD